MLTAAAYLCMDRGALRLSQRVDCPELAREQLVDCTCAIAQEVPE